MKPSTKHFIALVALAIILAVSFAYVADASHGRALEVKYPDLPGVAPLTSHTSLPALLNYFFRFFVVIGGLIAFGSFVTAGFLFMTSGANPGLRAKAMARIRQAILGLVLLLGTYVLLNTINPELVFLHAPGLSISKLKYTTPDIRGIFDEVDYDSLRYGGVVVFEEQSSPGLPGTTGRSEAIFHNVADFEKSTHIGLGKKGISFIKILGDCEVSLTREGIPTLTTSVSVPVVGDRQTIKGKKAGLDFINENCLGNSIKVFQAPEFNQGAPTVPREGFQGAHTLLTNASDLGKLFFSRDFSPSMDNKISSVLLAHDLAGPNQPPRVKLCDEVTYKDPCASLTNSSSTLGRPLNDKVSSIQFLSALARQAGVIVYKDANFGGFHEVFIASDASLRDSILGKEDEISSLQIIGKYRVTLYDNPNFDKSGAWLEFDNTDPAHPKENHSSNLSSGGGHEGSANNIFRVSDLGKYCFLEPGKNICTRETFSDKISSIKIEVPDEISADQKLGGACKDNFCTL